ncbi:nucleotidyltransferase domain-containing protein [Patescibacteria group bacterium]|nr:nucleotidyltransferase domain-containing protein [Patescibacteria group bacterium]
MDKGNKINSKSKETNNIVGEETIPGMDINKYSSKRENIPVNLEKTQKEFEKTKKDLEKIKIFMIKKYPFIEAIGILPPQALKLILEEEIDENIAPSEIQKIEKKVHLCIIVPESKIKDIPKIKKEIISEIERTKQEIWIHIKTPVDIWEFCLDSKFEVVNAIGMSFPLHDRGILSSLRVAEIHKTLVLQKFDKYVVSYVIAGSLVRGETTKESDVDSFVIINDTDVKRMPRLELKERLRGMIHQYIAEATALAGVKKNILNVQVYLLTDFWESVKDAHPVMFTFIRDGVPLYDKGTFLPWKALLKMGRLKPSPEAIDLFMSMGDKTTKRAKATFLDILVHDIYWGVLTPSQALLMLYGLPPPTPKQTIGEIKRVFVEKEKMLEKRYFNILENIVKSYKDYEHEKIKEIKGAELDKLLKDMDDYLNRLKELRKQIEKRTQEKLIEQIYKDLIDLLSAILGKKSQALIVSEFEEFVKKGKFTQKHLRILKEIIQTRTDFKKGKINNHNLEEARKNSTILINELIDYSQRCDLMKLEKGRMRIRYKDPETGKDSLAEILHCNGTSFLFFKGSVRKLTNKIENSNMEEVSNCMEQQKSGKELEINPEVFELLRKEFGEFKIVL